jgi:hypothetical protein
MKKILKNAAKLVVGGFSNRENPVSANVVETNAALNFISLPKSFDIALCNDCVIGYKCDSVNCPAVLSPDSLSE